jgi:acyl carrier protein
MWPRSAETPVALDRDALAAEITEFLRTKLRVDTTGVGLDTPLVSTGLVDSIALVRVASFLERRLGLRIPDRDVTVKQFDTLALMLGYLERRVARGA